MKLLFDNNLSHKLIVRIGNCRIVDIENIIRNNNIDIDDFYHKQDSGIIEID